MAYQAMKFALRHFEEPRGSPHRVRQSQRQPLHQKELINGRQGEEDLDAELTEKSAPVFVTVAPERAHCVNRTNASATVDIEGAAARAKLNLDAGTTRSCPKR
jgi:hypothetical protein